MNFWLKDGNDTAKPLPSFIRWLNGNQIWNQLSKSDRRYWWLPWWRTNSFSIRLEELRRYVDPEFYIKLKDKYSVHFYIYADITASYEEIVKSVKRVKSDWFGKDDIWFGEQGADFYFFYEVKNDAVELEYKRGPNVGTYNGKIPDLKLVISKSEYVQIWEVLFKDLALLI